MSEVRPPVALLRSVVRERVGAEIVPQRRRPPGKFQGVEAPTDVVEDLANDRSLGDDLNTTRKFGFAPSSLFRIFMPVRLKCGSRSPRGPLPDYGCPENRPLVGSNPVPPESNRKSHFIG